MSRRTHQNDPSADTPPGGGKTWVSVSGRSFKRGSGTRNRCKQMDTLVSVLKAVDELSIRQREFGTSDLRDKAGISMSQAYNWLRILRVHGFVSARMMELGRPSGDWRWRRRFKIMKID